VVALRQRPNAAHDPVHQVDIALVHQVFEGGVALGPPVLGPETDLEALAPVTRILGAVDLAPGRLPGAERLALAAPDVAVAAQMAVRRQPGPLTPLYMRPPDARLPGGRLPE
jgi:tRNA threonylcarbamoyladenosine biosynthesis protein TsaB